MLRKSKCKRAIESVPCGSRIDRIHLEGIYIGRFDVFSGHIDSPGSKFQNYIAGDRGVTVDLRIPQLNMRSRPPPLRLTAIGFHSHWA